MKSQEEKVMNLLGDAYNEFCNLDQSVTDGGNQEDVSDFRFHVHAAQNIVAARAGFRRYRKVGAENE